ncbi:uncharacterized protein SCHCODRAFT_02502055 [Schizophyllum commune H4-8]|nr:uncharacterized protein SCHCODRAFT_02502055 [Schizophyllum commune H4-8]KAI5892783.1 hypothetical protein SCHCODRAFT_02502055 [Schizophyllum commune H4-8]
MSTTSNTSASAMDCFYILIIAPYKSDNKYINLGDASGYSKVKDGARGAPLGIRILRTFLDNFGLKTHAICAARRSYTHSYNALGDMQVAYRGAYLHPTVGTLDWEDVDCHDGRGDRLCNTLLVWLAQRHAMRCLLLAPTKKAAGIHDEFNAWIGLGSALLTLYKQFSTPTAADKGYHAQSSDAQSILGGASSLLPFLAIQDYESTIGLVNATMYDRLAANSGALNTTVNATTFDVTCGALESLRVVSNNTDPHSGEVTSYSVSHVYPNGTRQRNIDLAYLAQNNTMIFTQHDVSANRHYNAENRSFYVYGTYDIQDSTGRLLPHLELPQRFNHSRNISMIGCNIYSYNHTIKVDTQTRLPLSGEVPSLRNTSRWFSWEPQPLISPIGLNILDLWTRAFREQYTTSLSLSGTAASSVTGSSHLGFMESFVMAILNLQESDSEGYVSSVPHLQARGRVQLHDMENSLRRLAAAYFWSFNQIDSNNRYGIERTATVSISIPRLVPQLQLNELPICIGLVVSTILGMTCVLLSRRLGPKRKEKVPDSLGLLQFLWLVCCTMSEVQHNVKGVVEPDEDTLRKECDKTRGENVEGISSRASTNVGEGSPGKTGTPKAARTPPAAPSTATLQPPEEIAKSTSREIQQESTAVPKKRTNNVEQDDELLLPTLA